MKPNEQQHGGNTLPVWWLLEKPLHALELNVVYIIMQRLMHSCMSEADIFNTTVA